MEVKNNSRYKQLNLEKNFVKKLKLETIQVKNN